MVLIFKFSIFYILGLSTLYSTNKYLLSIERKRAVFPFCVNSLAFDFFSLHVMSGILHNVIEKYEKKLNTVENFGTRRIKKLDSHCFCLLVFIQLHMY